MNKLYTVGLILIVCAVMFIAGMVTGYSRCKATQDRQQVKVYQQDSKKSLQLEAEHVARQKRTEHQVRIIRETVDDCANRPMPPAILEQLRSEGGPAGSTPAARLRTAIAERHAVEGQRIP